MIRRSTRQNGSVLLATALVGVSCAALAASMLATGQIAKRDCDTRWALAQRLALARAGIATAYSNVRLGGNGIIGTKSSPTSYATGSFYVEAVVNADSSMTLTSHGVFDGGSRAVRAVIRNVSKPIFDHAMYAGNSSGDSSYALEFGGTNGQADHVTGDVYSGNNIVATGAPVVSGTLRAAGTITGLSGTIGLGQPAPSLASMNYPVNNNVNVSQLFASVSSKTSNSSYGGSAYQLPATSPAHIFRKNPTDRASQTAQTVKDDYFLEDVYQTKSTSTTVDLAHATPVGLNTAAAAPGNDVVYYIDGNLWLHNIGSYTFYFKHPDTGGVQVTFAVRGNIYFCDNLVRKYTAKDGIAFIALKDPAVADSGSIYFGDADYGTLSRMDAFMYAENDFHDVNLDAGGSAHVTINGTMSAGDQIAIDRDYGSSHTRLDLNFDDRVIKHTINMPNLPPSLAGPVQPDYRIATQYMGGQ